MTRTVPSALLANYQSGSQTPALAVLVERVDGTQIARTSADKNVTLTGVPVAGIASGALLYESMPGLTVSSMVSTVGLGVDNLEGTMFREDPVLIADIYAGLWHGAHWSIVGFNWVAPEDGFVHLKSGRFGNITNRNGSKVFELRDYRQAAQADTTRRAGPTCDWEFGSTALPAGLCGVDLGPLTNAGEVTAVANTREVTTDLAEAADFYTNGLIYFLTGDNVDPRGVRVRSHPGSGVLILDVQMVRPIQIGDTLTAIAGCRKRFAEDCRDTYANQRRFGGFHEKSKSQKQVNPL